MQENIRLTPAERTAYWWINIIRDRIKEIAFHKSSNKDEIKFSNIFFNYTEVEWRKLYLELVKYINEDVNNYVPSENQFDIGAFSQDTEKCGHDKLNSEISKIIGQKIPDIRLSSNSSKDSVIYTNKTCTKVWYKSCGVRMLSNDCEPSYILTGDESKLNFFNLVVSTIALLNEKDSTFKSVSLLREEFCKEYKKLNDSEKTIEELTEMFNDAFDEANDKDLVLGRSYKKHYFCTLEEIDYISLEKYMEEAEVYASAILKSEKENNGIAFTKKL